MLGMESLIEGGVLAVVSWPLWTKLWKKLNDKLDEWADV